MLDEFAPWGQLGGPPDSAPFTFVCGIGPGVNVDTDGEFYVVAGAADCSIIFGNDSGSEYYFGAQAGSYKSNLKSDPEFDEVDFGFQHYSWDRRGTPDAQVQVFNDYDDISEMDFFGSVVVNTISLPANTGSGLWRDGVMTPNLDAYTAGLYSTTPPVFDTDDAPVFNDFFAYLGEALPDGNWLNGVYVMALYRGTPTAEDLELLNELYGPDEPAPVYGPVDTEFRLALNGNSDDLTAIVADVTYNADTSTIDWNIFQSGPSGEHLTDPLAEEGVTYGTIDVTGGVPALALWRMEADLDGQVRLYYDGELLGAPFFPDAPEGGRVGLAMGWAAGAPDEPGVRRPGVARFHQVSAGLQEPADFEELGMWVRIGVDHITLGDCWFFRGFVDAVVPTYVPDRPDAVRIECIDSLGEAGRAEISGDQLPHPFVMAPDRIRQVLNKASWPKQFRTIRDDSTLLSRPSSGKAVDMLTSIAESCGGAVYGDPVTGDVVFKGMDWQGWPPAANPRRSSPTTTPGTNRTCPGCARSAGNARHAGRT